MFIYILRRNQSVDPPGAPCWEALQRARFLGTCAHPVCMCCVYTARQLRDVFGQKLHIKRRREKANSQSNESRERGEMRLQLIMGLAADALHESNSLQPVCFHDNGISNY